MVVSATVAGPRHIEATQPSEDAILIGKSGDGVVVAISDGVGSVDHAKVGAEAAVAAAAKVAGAWLLGKVTTERVPAVIAKQWTMSLAVEPATAACTIAVAAVSVDGRWLAASLGDSPTVVWSRGRLRLPPERHSFADWTTARGATPVSGDTWTLSTGEDFGPGDAILLVTDGVADDLDLARLPDMADRLRSEVSSVGELATSKALERQLRAWPSAGHRDDKTLALVLA
jgi:serine/threonine protein phosphatase PrpC